MDKIGFGGGCHWCTEAVFHTLKGVSKVQQGWIASEGMNSELSEAVIVHFDPDIIDLNALVTIHLSTHSCTSDHPLRVKYRSAVYYFNQEQIDTINKIIKEMQSDFEKPIITKVLPFVSFKENEEKYQNYYQKNYDSNFCKAYINPKFSTLMKKFSENIDENKLKINNKN